MALTCLHISTLSLTLSTVPQVWLGYQQSLRPCQTGLMLNMDIAATAFLEPLDVIPFLNNALGRGADVTRGLNPMQLKKAARAIRGVQARVGRPRLAVRCLFALTVAQWGLFRLGHMKRFL